MMPDEIRMRARSRVKRIVGKVMLFVVLMPVVMFLFIEAVLHLWNWLMPAIFHLPAISFWQALGLMVLSWILLGGRRGMGGWRPRHGGRWRKRMHERWEEMTPEEREKFREWIRSRCGQGPVGAEPRESGS
jgi:uncharacterized membrane protein YbhN (UPF0104 family)